MIPESEIFSEHRDITGSMNSYAVVTVLTSIFGAQEGTTTLRRAESERGEGGRA